MLKLPHVIARLAKRARRCDDIAAVFPGERPRSGTCPGWRVVDLANQRAARLIACAPCNDLQPARLRVKDADIKLIPAALTALSQRGSQLRQAYQARSTTTHLREDVASMRVLCGHALGRTAQGRRTHRWTFQLGDTTCVECRRIGALTPGQRIAEAAARRADLRDRFAHKRAEKLELQAKEREVREALIAEARPDALVALDIIEARIDFAVGLGALDVMESDAKTTQEESALIYCALRNAVTAYKHEHKKSRGDRLWVLRDFVAGIGIQYCRFCGEQLARGVRLGTDKSFAGSPPIAEHTVRCALRYLAGTYLPPPSIDREDSAPHV